MLVAQRIRKARDTRCHGSIRALLLAVLAAGCGDTETTEPRRTVRGIAGTRHVTPSGTTFQPADTNIEVIATADFSSYSAHTEADGTFVIEGVPGGSYWLPIGTTFLDVNANAEQTFEAIYYELDAEQLDLTRTVVGRADVMFEDLAHINLIGIDPAADAEFVFAVPNSGIAARRGTVVSDRVTFGLSGRDPLVDAARGDVVTFSELTKVDGAFLLNRTMETSNVSTAGAGNITDIQAQFTTPPLATYELGWDRSAFAALHPRPVEPSGEEAQYLHIYARPGDAGLGKIWRDRGRNPDPVPAHLPIGIASSDWPGLTLARYVSSGRGAPGPTDLVDTAAWPVGDPYPSEWSRIVTVSVERRRESPTYVNSYTDIISVTREASTGVVEPLVGPPEDITLMRDQGVVTAMSWSAPSYGIASRYRITVFYRSETPFGTVGRVPRYTLVTTSTSCVFPPGMIPTEDQGGYASFAGLDIAAEALPGVDVTHEPERLGFPHGVASVVALE